MKNKKAMIWCVVAIFIILAWAPWLSVDSAKQKVLDSFNTKWYDVSDGCGKYNQTTGKMEPDKINVKKFPFGVLVKIDYDCGLGIIKLSAPAQHDKIFVGFWRGQFTITQKLYTK